AAASVVKCARGHSTFPNPGLDQSQCAKTRFCSDLTDGQPMLKFFHEPVRISDFALE
ncbi:MAG: hypothetical protein ACJAYU_005181, partial [Bradymonadia bacterium]